MMILALLAAAVVAVPEAGQPLYSAAETAIRDAGGGGIRDWYSGDDRTLYLRDRTGRWYRATFAGVCPAARRSSTIRFNTDALGAFDRFGTISTDRGRCSVSSLVRSAKPAAIGRR